MSNICEGCRAFEEDECIVQIESSIGEYKCPCAKCLVKGICNELCKEFLGYIRDYRIEVIRLNPIKVGSENYEDSTYIRQLYKLIDGKLRRIK